MVLLVGPDKIIAAGVELKILESIKDADNEQEQLGIEEQRPVSDDACRQRRQDSGHECIFLEALNLH